MEENDVLAIFQLNVPLTEEEKVFLNQFNHEFPDVLQKLGISIHVKNEQWYLNQIRPVKEKHFLFFEDIREIAVKLGESSDVSVFSLCAGVWAFSLRLILTTFMDLKDSDMFNAIINNYASSLRRLGFYQKSRLLYKEAWQRNLKVLGDKHRDTLATQNNYAYSCCDSGYFEEAVSLLKQTWEKCCDLGVEDCETLACMNNYAFCVYKCGYLEKAELLLRETVKKREKVLGKDHLHTLSSMNNYALCIESMGRVQEAEPLFKLVLKKYDEILGSGHPDTITSLSNYALCLGRLGRLQEAEPLFKRGLEQSIDNLGETHPISLGCLSNYAFFLHYLVGRHQEAESFCEQAWKLRSETLGKKHPDTLNSLDSYVTCLQELERFQEAEPLAKQVWKGRLEVLGDQHTDTLYGINNYAAILMEWKRFQEATSLFKQVWESRQQILGDKHIDTLIGLDNYVSCFEELESSEETLRLWQILSEKLADKPFFRREWTKLVRDVARIFSKKYILEDKFPTWSKHFQSLSYTYAEILDLQIPEQIEVIRADFITYHATYLDLCIKQNRFDLIPSILAIIQGRKLAALLLDEIEQNPVTGDDETAELKRRFLILRAELRQLAIGLQAISNNKLNRFSSSQLPVETQLKIQMERLTEYEQKYDQLRNLRQQLQEQDDNFGIATPMLDITAERLQNGLRKGHAIALLVQKIIEVPPFFLLITKDRLQFITLPEGLLEKAYQQTLAYQKTSSTRRGMRHTYYEEKLYSVPTLQQSEHKDNINSNEEPVTLNSLQNTLSNFWQSVEAIPDIQCLHLITQGELHILPYELGCPTHLQLYTYPGLLFYYQIHHYAPHTVSSFGNKTLGMKVYNPLQSSFASPIPLVEAEKSLIKQVWQGETLYTLTDFTQQLLVLHFACHGKIRFPEDPLSAYLFLGESQKEQLDARQILRSHIRSQVVFQSACVVGRVTEDIDGDPLGLVTAFFLQGTQYIIAAIQEIDDFYMPLLVCLFYQTWQHGRITPHDALREAKRRLRTGEWYSDTEEWIRKSYYPAMMNYLQHLVKEEDEYTLQEEVIKIWPTSCTLNVIDKQSEVYQEEVREIQEYLMTSLDYHSIFVTSVLNTLCNHKFHLPVADLCTWVRGFGWFES